MDDVDVDAVARLIREGMPADEAISTAMGEADDSLTKYVLPIEGLGTAPDPACVAAQLQGIANPSREDIARAIAHCSR